MNTLHRIFLETHLAESASRSCSGCRFRLTRQILTHGCFWLLLSTLGVSGIRTAAADSLWQGPAAESDWFLHTGPIEFPIYSNWLGGLPGPATAQTTVANGGTAVISGNDPITGAAANAGNTLVVDSFSSVDLRAGSLTVVNEELGQTGTGTFNQEGGTHAITDFLAIGNLTGSTGIYNLRGGSLTVGNESTVGNEFVGFGGTGIFNQTSGTQHSVSGTLTVGSPGSQGTYNLGGGTLNATNEIIGDGTGSIGIFNQTGGTHTVSNTLTIGRFGGQGTYNLSGDASVLTASNEFIGRGGSGIFNQSGGTHTVNNTLTIGSAEEGFDGNGTYNLGGGSLNATNEIIGTGTGGVGIFNQTGGTHTVSDTLTIGQFGGQGTYNLGGGNLNVANEFVGLGGTGFFNQIGGTHTVSDSLTIGSNGTYGLIGGALSAPNVLNNGTFFQSGGAIGTNVFTNNNTYTYFGGTFSGSFLNNGTAVFNPVERSIFGANISGDGVLTKLGDATLILTGKNSYRGGTTVTRGILQGNTDSLQGDIVNNATVVFDQAATGIYSGNISGEGNVVKQNAGLLVFNGNSTYTGGTQVVGGNLQVGDATHPGASILGLVNVGPNGTLSGHGTINGNVENSGTIAPGGSIGTLTVGNATFQRGSTFQTAIDPTRASVLNVKGLASLGDAQVDVVAADGAYGPRRYTILSANSITGRFLDQVTSNFAAVDPLLTPSLAYDSNNVFLDLNPVRIPDPMGGATKVATDTIYMIDRLVAGRFNSPLGELCSTSTLGFWGRGIGMLSSASAAGDNPGYSGGTSGFVLGVDGQPTERLSLGIVGFSAHSDVTTNTVYSNRSTVNMGGFNLYGAYTAGAWQLRSALGYSNESYASQQLITAGSQQRRAQGSTEANRLSNYTEGSYTFKAGALALQPLLAMQFGWMQQDGFTQNGLFGDGQGLNVNGRTQYVLDTLAGARARQDFPVNDSMKVQVELRALYMHQFGTLQNSTSGSLTGGQAVSLSTQDRPGERDAGILGAGITLLTANSVNVYLDYNGQVLSSQTANFFSAGVRYAW